MHGPPQGTCALAVHDTDLQYPLLAAFLKILRNQEFDFYRTESMKIEGAVNRKLDRVDLFHG
jgi:hypothetical protein